MVALLFFLQDKAPIAEFGPDIDTQPDCAQVMEDHIIQEAVTALKMAIRVPDKPLAAFHEQQPKKRVIRKQHLNY